MEGESKVTAQEAARQVALVCRRLGMLHVAYARVLVETLGQEEGERVATKAIKRYARWIGSAKREKAEEAGLRATPETFTALTDLPSLGMHARYEELEVDGESRSRAYGCVMGEVWRDMGESRLGRLYCYVDPASAMAFNHDFKLVHTKALPDGDAFCEFAFRLASERDREQFESEDTNWADIEGD